MECKRKGEFVVEEWRDIKGYEGRYQISNAGRVKSLLTWKVAKGEFEPEERIMHPTDNGHGYLLIGLKTKGKKKNRYIHRLVAETFIDNPENKPAVNHKDYNRANNVVENLEWVTVKENVAHSVEHMKHEKNYTHSSTGEKYIYYRKEQRLYRVSIKDKEYHCKTLEDAIAKRDVVLRG